LNSVVAYIALGSNLGERGEFIRRATEQLGGFESITVTAQSSVAESAALAGMDQPGYLDCVVKVATSLSADELFCRMVEVEDSLGRVRTEKWGPRTIDLDLLIYGDEVIETDRLCVPHKQMHLRSFVLKGMCELDGELVHPVLGVSMNELAGRLNGGDFFIDDNKPQLISIAGVIGVGKTTLGLGLAGRFGSELLREAYDTNPFLAEAYEGKDVALDSQLYFLMSRFDQLGMKKLDAGKPVVSDYVFEKDRIFAEQTLNDTQFSEYSVWAEKIAPAVSQEAVVIYLRDEIEVILERIHKRNRPYEQRIELDWLKGLGAEYDKLFAGWKKCPVITLSTSEFDGRRNEDVDRLFEQLKHYISGKWE
jgi:deoxyguanosine kinase